MYKLISFVVSVIGAGNFFIPILCLLFLMSGTTGYAFSQDVKDAQVLLNSLGYDAGVEDGISGNKTKAALNDFYSSQQKAFDGVLNENELIDLMDFIDSQAAAQNNDNSIFSEPNPYQMPIFVLLAVFVLIFWVGGRNKKVSAKTRNSPAPFEENTRQQEDQTITKFKSEPTSVSPPELKAIPAIEGKCHVIDGDTIVIGKQHIRFSGINAPELDEPYGKQAKWALVGLCKGQVITAYPNGETSYNRIVAKCFLPDGRDLAAEMVKMELALDIPHYPDADYRHLETPSSRRKLRWKPKLKG